MQEQLHPNDNEQKTPLETTDYLQKGKEIVSVHKNTLTEKTTSHAQKKSEIDTQLAPLKEKGMEPSSSEQKKYENYLSAVRSCQAEVIFPNHESDEEKVQAYKGVFGPAGISRESSTEKLLAYYEQEWQRCLQAVVDYEDAGFSPRSQEQAYFDEQTEKMESEEAIIKGLDYELDELESLDEGQIREIARLDEKADQLIEALNILTAQMEKEYRDSGVPNPLDSSKVLDLLTESAKVQPGVISAYDDKTGIYPVDVSDLAMQITYQIAEKAKDQKNHLDIYLTSKNPIRI